MASFPFAYAQLMFPMIRHRCSTPSLSSKTASATPEDVGGSLAASTSMALPDC